MSTRKQNPASTTAQGPSSIPITRQYLVLYNLASFLLWASLLLRILITLSTGGYTQVYPVVGMFARNIQTVALAEILHSVFGLVRAPFITTALQVASRITVVWSVVDLFAPGLGLGARSGAENNQIAYTGMLGAWTVTEIVRYSYFVAFLGNGGNVNKVPSFLTWARYNLFFVLYPVGIACEVWMVYHSLPMAETLHTYYAWFLRGALLVYVPGSYIMFTHMMGQRRRIMRGKQKVMSE